MTKILAVDDDRTYLNSTSLLLKKLLPECIVITAQSGRDGLHKARTGMPDTILLDLNMPELDGFEVCRKLKSDAVTRHIPVIMLTGAGTEVESRVRGLETGADAYLTKPFHSDELTAQIKAMLRIKDTVSQLKKYKHSLERELEERKAELESKTQHLSEIDGALKALLRQRDEDKENFQEDILLNLKQLVLPYLETLRQSRLGKDQAELLGILESNLNDIASPFVRNMSSSFLNLTPMEIRIAGLVKEGKTNKEIAELLTVSVHTVITHRRNLRNKLGLRNKKANLSSYLLSISE